MSNPTYSDSDSPQGRSQSVTGRDRNSSTGMPPPPTSKLRFGLKASLKAAKPGSATEARPPFSSIATTTRPARSTKAWLRPTRRCLR